MYALLEGYWNKYYDKIFWTQFLPFMCYMVGIMSFLLYALQDNVNERVEFAVLYYPLLGYCMLFMVN